MDEGNSSNPRNNSSIFSHLVGEIEGFQGSSEMLKNYKELKVCRRPISFVLKSIRLPKAFRRRRDMD